MSSKLRQVWSFLCTFKKNEESGPREQVYIKYICSQDAWVSVDSTVSHLLPQFKDIKQKGFKMFVKILVLISLSSSAVWAQSQCVDMFQNRSAERKALRDVDLEAIMLRETNGKSPEEISDMNAKTISDIEAEIPSYNSSRKSSISMESAEFLRRQINENPVAGSRSDLYEQPNTSIGYCFGRATFVHLMLLKMGVQKESIQKIFAVGTMAAGGINWQFHVATMAYSETNGWLVIDSNHARPMAVRDWIAHYNKQSPSGRIRFYATDASKFTFKLGKYSRAQLGLDMPRKRDWYKHYFKDLMAWLETKRVTENSIETVKANRPVTKEEKTIKESIAGAWRSFIEFIY